MQCSRVLGELGEIMPLDGSSFEDRGYSGRWCRACRLPILTGQRAARVDFQTDPHGTDGLTGDYHAECSKPFASMARVINLNPWGR
jgi:hypothetical protein